MKIDGVKIPQSSFLSAEKDFQIITNKMLKNERLKRLLFYTTKDALSRPNLTEEQSIELVGKNIKSVPKLEVDSSVLNYVFIRFDGYTPSSNPQFRDNLIEFDVICHYDQWTLKDFALRPYKIAAEIDSMLNNQKLTGIGTVQFVGADLTSMNDEFAGLCLIYNTVHGGEDKKGMPNPADEEQFQQDFKDYINNA